MRAARTLARRALRPRVGMPSELASLPARCVEAACALSVERGSGRLRAAAPCGLRGFSARGSSPPDEPPEDDSQPPKPEERVLLPRWGAALDELYWSALAQKARLQLLLYRRFIQPDFDEALFLEGATDAYFAVNELWPAGDAAALAPLTSQPVAESFAAMLAGYRDEGMAVLFKTTAFHRARITDFSLVSRGEIRRRGLRGPRAAVAAAAAGDEAAGARDEDGGGSGFVIPGVGMLYISFSVRYDVEDEVELRRGGPLGPLVMRMRDLRGHVWTFVRPLPRDVPFEGTDTPWKLTDIA